MILNDPYIKTYISLSVLMQYICIYISNRIENLEKILEFTVNSLSVDAPKIHDGKRRFPSINGVGQTEYASAKESM